MPFLGYEAVEFWDVLQSYWAFGNDDSDFWSDCYSMLLGDYEET